MFPMDLIQTETAHPLEGMKSTVHSQQSQILIWLS